MNRIKTRDKCKEIGEIENENMSLLMLLLLLLSMMAVAVGVVCRCDAVCCCYSGGDDGGGCSGCSDGSHCITIPEHFISCSLRAEQFASIVFVCLVLFRLVIFFFDPPLPHIQL